MNIALLEDTGSHIITDYSQGDISVASHAMITHRHSPSLHIYFQQEARFILFFNSKQAHTENTHHMINRKLADWMLLFFTLGWNLLIARSSCITYVKILQTKRNRMNQNIGFYNEPVSHWMGGNSMPILVFECGLRYIGVEYLC